MQCATTTKDVRIAHLGPCDVTCFGAIQVLRNVIFLEIGPPPTPS